jgi:hypothetical protein
MYGSDGGKIPETHWIAAVLGKEGISRALQDMVDSGFMDEVYACKAGSWILYDNAKNLYRVKCQKTLIKSRARAAHHFILESTDRFRKRREPHGYEQGKDG